MNVFKLIKEVECEGVGLHTGSHSYVRFTPTANGGVTFLKNNKIIPARLEYVVNTERGVTLGVDGVSVATVEHLLAAIRFLGIQHVQIEIEGEEVPVLDGSALPWVQLLKPHLEETKDNFPERILFEPVRVGNEEVCIKADPSNSLHIEYSIDFPQTPVGFQGWSGAFEQGLFQEEIAPARTFGFLEEVEALRNRGLAQGGNAENCVVIAKDKVLTPLRFKDEMIRHKVLDLMGDIALLPWIPQARLGVQKASHKLHIELAKALEKQARM